MELRIEVINKENYKAMFQPESNTAESLYMVSL